MTCHVCHEESDHLIIECQGGCGIETCVPGAITDHEWARYDNYGIYTGVYCEKCYRDDSKYGYRRDDYFDPGYAGESLDEDY